MCFFFFANGPFAVEFVPFVMCVTPVLLIGRLFCKHCVGVRIEIARNIFR